MAITINGTTGIAGVDGSAGTPALQGADTNTGIFFPAADTIAFAEGGVEAARFDSSGNLGIGTATPVSRLTIAGASAVLSLVDTDRSVNTYGAVWADQAGNLFLIRYQYFYWNKMKFFINRIRVCVINRL